MFYLYTGKVDVKQQSSNQLINVLALANISRFVLVEFDLAEQLNRTEHNLYWCKIHIQRIVTKTTH